VVSVERGELIVCETLTRQLVSTNVKVGSQYPWNHDNKWWRDRPKSVYWMKTYHHKITP